MSTSDELASTIPHSPIDPVWRRVLFEENFQPAWIYDLKTLAFLEVNPAAIERYGYTRDEFLRMTLKDIRPPEDVPALLDRIANFETGRYTSGEWRHLRRDGTLIYAEVMSYDIDHDGRPCRLAIINDVTERHLAEETLKKTIQDYRGLFENAHDAILIISADDEKILDVNQRACAVYGFSRGEFLGMTLASISLEPEKSKENVAETLLRGKHHHFEIKHRRQDDTEMFLEINAAAITYKNQQAIVTINRDVTERKLAEKAMRSEEQRRRLHVEQTPLAVIEWDANFCFRDWNPAAQRIFGFTKEEVVGQYANLILPLDEQVEVGKVLPALLAARGGLRSTNRNITKDGRVILCEWYNTPLIDEAGHVVGVASLVQDVTATLLMQEALQTSEKNYRTLAEAIPAIMYTADAERTIDYCNHRWYEYTGMPAGSAKTRWTEAIHPDDLERVVREGGRGAASGEATELEYRMRRHDGAYRWFLSRSLPLRDSEGQIARWVGLSTDIDDRKRAEEALAASESRFRSLAESVADFVSLHDMTGRFEYASPSCTDLTGFNPEELVGRDAYEIMHLDDRARVRRDSHETNLAGRESMVSWRLRRKDEKYVWVETNASIVKDDQGQPVQILCATRDISARKLAEDALREQKEILQTIFDYAPVMVSFFDPRGRYLLVNRAWQETLGYSAEDALARDVLSEMYPDPDVLKRVREFITRGDGTWGDFPSRTRDGRVLDTSWIDIRVEGGPIIGLGQDVTKRKRDEQLLRQSEERLRQIAENIEEIFWVMDPAERRTLYVSPAFERIWQQSAQELYDQPANWINSVHPDDRATAFVQDVTEGWDKEFRLLRKDGSIRWLHSRAMPVRDIEGKVYRVVGITQDITERKELENQLRRHAQELNELVRERTERIRELERQRVEAEKVVATGRIAARIAHEINNPLAGIASAFALIKDAVPTDNKYHSYVARVEGEIERISQITRQMFVVYRPETEPAKTFCIGDTLREVVALLEPSAEARRVCVNCCGGTSEMQVTLPEHALRQVMLNIIRNAIEASPEDAKVEVSTSVASDANDRVVIAITDHGSGIEEAHRDQIFEPFFTTKSTMPSAGLGLGLSVANSLTLAMGGHIEFDTVVGQGVGHGTTFRVVLPLQPRSSE
ncbi:MAG: PAS domain S-box protein [Anaerolineae bacterium]|nr:PAS domain S-box protein [Phycisphaerae bacterium]